jgi:coatomer protein complex subunit epsilon
MPPLTSHLELLNLHNAFHQGQYSAVLKQNTSTLSSENTIAAKVFVYRARIASGQAEDVIKETGSAAEPDLQAVKAFAEYTAGNTSSAVTAIDGLVGSASDNGTVQVLGATVLHMDGRSDEALSLLSKHQGNLEAYATPTRMLLSGVQLGV